MSIKNIFSILKKNREKKEDINIEELENIIRTSVECVLIDVRSPQEYNEGHLKRSNKHTAI